MADIRAHGTFLIGSSTDDLIQGYNPPGSPGDMGRNQILTGFSAESWNLYKLVLGSSSTETYKETAAEVFDGNDVMLGGFGDDALFGGGGDDRLIGGADSFYGNNDTLYGGWGDDVLIGGNAAQTTDGGQDKLYGGPGRDVLNGMTGADLLDGGVGVDVAIYSLPRSSYSISFDEETGGVFIADPSSVKDSLTGVEYAFFQTAMAPTPAEAAARIARYIADPASEPDVVPLLQGLFTSSADTVDLSKLTKDDVIEGRNLNDAMAGDDVVTLASEKVKAALGLSIEFHGGRDNDTITASSGAYTIYGDHGEDTFILKGKGFKVFGEDSATTKDYQKLGSGNHDTLSLKGSVDQYTITADPTSKVLYAVVKSVSGDQSYSSKGVEKIAFEKAAQNKVNLELGWVGETASQMKEIYDEFPSGMTANWHRVEAIELDIDPADKKYTMSEGIFKNIGGLIPYDAMAAVTLGVVNNLRTLSISFKGTDDKWTGELLSADFGYNLSSYYDLFKPMVDGIKAYVKDAANGIQKVVINGHSLGGAMTQFLASELGTSSLQTYGYTYGSIGTPPGKANTNAHQTNFVHIGDIASGLVKFYDVVGSGATRDGGIVWLNARYSSHPIDLHDYKKYQENVDFLMGRAQSDAAFKESKLAKALLGDGWTKGSVQVDLGGNTVDSFMLSAKDAYAYGGGGDDNFTLYDTINGIRFDTHNEEKYGNRIIDGGKDEDIVYLASSYGSYIRTITKNGNLKISQVSDGKLVAEIENSVEYIVYGIDKRTFDGTKVAAKVVAGTKDVVLSGTGSYVKVGAGDGDVIGTKGRDMIVADSGNKTIKSGAGNDSILIQGSKTTDTVLIDGGTGGDFMSGGKGKETYVVDHAGDLIIDLGGSDRVKSSVNYVLASGLERLDLTGKASYGGGNSGANVLVGTATANTLDGFAGNDTLDGSAGNDTLTGGVGADKLQGGAGLDTASYTSASKGVTVSLLTPSANTNDAKGDTYASIENVSGSSFTDRISGNTSANKLAGGAGDDVLYGGAGKDSLYGGGGKDAFTYKVVSDSAPSKTGADTIFDFTSSDRIDLSGIDANSKVGGDQAFSFVASGKFSGKAGELRYDKENSDTYLYGDVNGDKTADFCIHLDDPLGLQQAMLVL